ncbi:MAG: WecB/TagA/CpsF family glycosyltransferase, partial [Planctomycetota bacterium]
MLIPAHDEAAVIAKTVGHVKQRLGPRDRVLVVADNCTDGTAAAARDAGAEVVERDEPGRRGKGFALGCGVTHLAADPPEVVFVLDADCRVGTQTPAAAAVVAAETGRPVQSLNLCRGGGVHAGISTLGFRFKNMVRPLGLRRLGLPCHLSGTGMALPWDIAARMARLDDTLAEDMQLGLTLTAESRGPLFRPASRVVSPFPETAAAFDGQRTRWEQGHLRTIGRVPDLMRTAIKSRSYAVAGMAADMLVPPLSLFVATGLLLLGAAGVFAVFGVFVPLAVAGSAFAVTVAAVLAGWAVFCRRTVPAGVLLSVPVFVARKIPIYLKFFTGRGESKWKRTGRESADGSEGRGLRIGAGPLIEKVDPRGFETVRVFGRDLAKVTLSEAAAILFRWATDPVTPGEPDDGIPDGKLRCRMVVTPNVDHIVQLRRNAALAAAYDRSAMRTTDGFPVVVASRLLGRAVPDRVTGADLIPAMFDLATAERPLRVFLLGAMPGVADRAAEAIAGRWSGVEVVGTNSPPLGFETDRERNAAIIEAVNASRPDLLVVGLGAPKQEVWLASHLDEIDARVAVCAGATIDFLAGNRSRAPRWMCVCGVEWVYRMLQEPRRLVRRYARDAVILPWIFLRECLGLSVGVDGASSTKPGVPLRPSSARPGARKPEPPAGQGRSGELRS